MVQGNMNNIIRLEEAREYASALHTIAGMLISDPGLTQREREMGKLYCALAIRVLQNVKETLDDLSSPLEELPF